MQSMPFPQKYCCNHRWEDAARGRKTQQVIGSCLNFQPAAMFRGCVQCWDVGICFDAGSYLVKISLLFHIVSHFATNFWAGWVKGLMFQNQDHQNPSQGTSGMEVPWAVLRPVHVFVCLKFVCISRSGAPCSCTNSSRSVVSNYKSRSGVSVHWLVWHHYA